MSKSTGRFSPFYKQCFVTAAVCSDVIGHGCILGYPVVLLPQLKKNPVITITDNEASWIASVLGIAMLVGILMTPPIMGRLGRKAAHYTVILTLLAAWIIFAIATSIVELIIARILQGLSFGMFTPLRSTLIGEYTSTTNRGAFLTTISLAQGVGITLVHLLGTILNWKATALICASFSFNSLIMTIYSPESPSWLAERGEYDKCEQAFHWLRGHDEEKELQNLITSSVTKDSLRKTKESLITTLKKEGFYKPILIMIHIYFLYNFSGPVILSAYATTIVERVMPKSNADYWMVELDLQRIVINSIAVYVINKIRRRTMVFLTVAFTIIIHVAIASYAYAKNEGLVGDYLPLPVILLNIHYFTIGMGLVPLPSVIAGEIFPLAYKSLASSICMVFYAGFSFLTLRTFDLLLNSVGLHGTYIVYTGICSYNLIVLTLLLPETKGKSLQEIENEFKC